MYRSALVALRPDGSNDVLIQFAVDLAKRYDLHLSGASILDRDLAAPREPVPLGGMAFKQERDAAKLAELRRDILANAESFCEACRSAGIAHDVEASEQSLITELARESQRHDVLLLGRAAKEPRDAENSRLHAILRRCPGAALLVPHSPSETSDSVVLAYDGSVQAARAMKSFVASGFLAEGLVHIVAFDDDLEEARTSADFAVSYLAHHGRRNQVTVGTSDASSAPQLILNACALHKAQMLVMGAYGKTAMHDFFLGSVTRSVLSVAQLPVFVDH
jgi:nucleotide-binding universal stress UspA family protein